MSDTAVMEAAASVSGGQDPVESSSLPEEAKEFIRGMDAEESAQEPSDAGEAETPAEPPPATADDAPQPVKVPSKPEPARPTLSEKQRELLRETQLTEAEVANLAPDQLDLVLSMIKGRDQRLIRAAQARQQAQQRERDEAGRFLPKQEPQPPGAQAAKPQWPELKKVSEGGEYDDAIVDVFNALRTHNTQLEERLSRVDEFFQTQQQREEQRQIEENTAWFDEQFSGLGEAFVSVFGKGTVRDIDPHSREFAARDAVARAAYALASVYPNDKPEELFRKAVAANHSDIFAQQHRAEINGQLLKQSGRRLGAGSTVRAPAREVDPRDPDGTLRETFERMLRENGSRA
jgi:hypothetical protein